MNCAETKTCLSAYLDHEMSLAEQQNVRSHLDDCVFCSAELLSLRNVKAMLKAEPAPALPSCVMDRIQVQTILRAPWWNVDLNLFRWFLPVALGTAALSAVLLFQWLHSTQLNDAGAVMVARYRPLHRNKNQQQAIALHRDSQDSSTKNFQ